MIMRSPTSQPWGAGALTAEKILERWEYLIEQGAGKAEDFFTVAADTLMAAEPPAVTHSRENIRAGGLLTGKNYDFIVVRNRNLKDNRLYLTAFDYGTSLHTVWFLTAEPGLLKRLLAGVLKWFGYDVYALDIPKQLEASAYVSTVHSAAKKAVQALMDKLGQDFSKVNTKTKGFLEIW